MRQVFFLIAFILLCIKAPCQSLTFHELTDSLKRIDDSAFLIPRGFVLVKHREMEFVFKKNENTSNEEGIYCEKGGFGYESKNVNYIKALLKQERPKLRRTRVIRQVDQNDSRLSGTRYEFTNGKMHISFVIFKNYGIIGIDFVHP